MSVVFAVRRFYSFMENKKLTVSGCKTLQKQH